MPISRSTTIAAPAAKVWDLVSDLPGMGRLSNENVGGAWLGGATGPAAGVRFRGKNRNGWHRWSTTATVEVASPGEEFTFSITYFGIPVSRWSYQLSPTDQGCEVTESWTDRRPGWFKGPAGMYTGVANRDESTARSIEHTLAALKSAAEQ